MKQPISAEKILPLLFIVSLLSCSNAQNAPKPHQQPSAKEGTTNPTTDIDRYSSQKLGISFSYPAEWLNTSKGKEIVNLSGKVTAVEISFKDTINQSTLFITYHFAPHGSELYQYALSQFEASQGWYAKNAKRIQVAGTNALQANLLITKNGKGNKIEQPLRKMIVDFVDSQKNGEIQVQFQTPANETETAEVEKFNRVLSSFKLSH